MGTKVWIGPADGFKIKQLSIFDLSKLCKVSRIWYNKLKYDFFEKEHLDKEESDGKVLDIEWIGKRKVDGYVRYWIRLGIHGRRINKIQIDGKVLDSGYVDITVASWIELDYEGLWGKNAFARFLGQFYNKYVIKRKLDAEYKPKLFKEVSELRDIVKEQLELYK